MPVRTAPRVRTDEYLEKADMTSSTRKPSEPIVVIFECLQYRLGLFRSEHTAAIAAASKNMLDKLA